MKESIRTCAKCDLGKPVTAFYTQSGRGRPMAYCKDCVNQATLDRISTNRTKAIAHKGGACARCGFQGCEAAFDFHHPNPDAKEKNVGRMFSRSWKNVLKEIEKCELLCAICHRSEHCSHSRCPSVEPPVSKRGPTSAHQRDF